MVKINITLKFLGTGYNDYYQASVKIYDYNNCIVYDGISYNSIVNVCLDKGCVYKVYAVLFGYYLIASIYVGNEDVFIFNFNPFIEYRTVTFLLTDYNYYNLPIMEGEILLGKDN